MPRKKTPTLVPPSTPRNPLVVAALTRRAGAHGKTGKARRQQMRQRTRQCLTGLLNGDKAEFEID
ncbi:MAG: hypothetical protein AB1899_13225 [Pseudomonadota bacterium]